MKNWPYIVVLILAVVLAITLILTLVWAIRNIDKLHLEKIPFLRPFILGFDFQLYIRANLCPITPITWDMLDAEPEGYDYMWFNLLNSYTSLQLKRYMQENNLYILPKEYLLEYSSDFEEVLQVLEFGKLSDLEKP